MEQLQRISQNPNGEEAANSSSPSITDIPFFSKEALSTEVQSILDRPTSAPDNPTQSDISFSSPSDPAYNLTTLSTPPDLRFSSVSVPIYVFTPFLRITDTPVRTLFDFVGGANDIP